MPKFKKQLILRPKQFRADFRILTKNQRLQFRGSFPKDNFKLEQQPAKWTEIYRCYEFKILKASAMQSSDFVIQGQKIFVIVFKNGQKLRIEPRDLPFRHYVKAWKIMNQELGFNGHGQRYVKQSASRSRTIHET